MDLVISQENRAIQKQPNFSNFIRAGEGTGCAKFEYGRFL